MTAKIIDFRVHHQVKSAPLVTKSRRPVVGPSALPGVLLERLVSISKSPPSRGCSANWRM